MNSNQSADKQLMQKMAAGCQHSFNALFEKYWETTYISAYKRLKDKEQAQDIAQEIFTYIWSNRETLEVDNFPGYLYIAVRNRVFKQMAKQKQTHPFFNMLENLPCLNEQTDSNLLAKEFLSAYEALVNALPLKKQRIFRLRFEEEMSTKQIAHQFGLSRKTVQNQITRSVKYLRAALFYGMVFVVMLQHI